MSKMLYVSVPMNGQPAVGLEMARMIEETIKAYDGDSLVPHDIPPFLHPKDQPCPPGYSHHEGHSSACYLRSDIIWMLRHADGVVFGPGWEHSIGCRLEMQVAIACGLPVYWFDPEEAQIRDTTLNLINSF